MADVNVGQLLATTTPYYEKKIAKTIRDNNPLLNELRSKNRDLIGGGESLREPIFTAENSNAGFYSGAERLAVSDAQVIDAATFTAKQAYTAVVVNGAEESKNASKEAMVNLVAGKLDAAIMTLENIINTSLFSDGTGSAGKEIDGLAAAVPEDPTTGTYGGIDRSVHSFWRNIKFQATVDGSGATTSSNIRSYWNSIFVQTAIGMRGADIIVAGNDYFSYFLEDRQDLTRIVNSNDAGVNIARVPYMGANVLLGGGYHFGSTNTGLTAKKAYFLNSNFLSFKTYRGRNFNVIGEAEGRRYPIDQDAYSQIFGWMGNLTCSNCRAMAVHFE